MQKAILESVMAAGVLSVALLAPNALKSLHRLGLMPKLREREYVVSSASKLVKKGLLRFNGRNYELTKAGEKILKLWSIHDFELKRPKKWDGKWRLIIFDIPEKKRKVRMRIPPLFTRAGLYRLQDSIWVYPHDCEDLIGLLKTEWGVGKEILYIIADEIENDKYLRTHFNLHS